MSSLITCPFQVLCEGDGDQGFLDALQKAYGLPSFQIRTVANDGSFEAKLKSLNLFVERGEVTRVLIVADNDSDPHASLSSIQAAIKRCGKYPVPKEPLKVRHSGVVQTAVMMLPGAGLVGNLETLLLKGVAAREPELLQCVQGFANCAAPSDSWPKGNRDKMLLRSVVAASVQSDPNCSLAFVWRKSDCPIDIKCNEFRWVAEFLEDFFRD